MLLAGTCQVCTGTQNALLQQLGQCQELSLNRANGTSSSTEPVPICTLKLDTWTLVALIFTTFMLTAFTIPYPTTSLPHSREVHRMVVAGKESFMSGQLETKAHMAGMETMWGIRTPYIPSVSVR